MSSAAPIFTSFIVFGVPMFLLACIMLILVLIIVRLLRGGREQRNGATDDARLVQEIYHGLTKMEQRIEALETLLLERDGAGSRR